MNWLISIILALAVATVALCILLLVLATLAIGISRGPALILTLITVGGIGISFGLDGITFLLSVVFGVTLCLMVYDNFINTGTTYDELVDGKRAWWKLRRLGS